LLFWALFRSSLLGDTYHVIVAVHKEALAIPCADVNLTKNPKDLAKDAGRALNKATPDLSEAPSPYDTAREQRTEANVSFR
jgi:hypothetical protein